MKPSILVPVDFTDNAFNAYLYANNLAYHLDCTLHLVHVAEKTKLPLEDETTQKKSLRDKLSSFSRWHPNEVSEKFYPVETTVEVCVGNVVEEIISASQRDAFRLIVCATRDKHTLMDRWLGTVSSEIALNASIPVILVPRSSEFSNLDSIVVGCDEHARDEYVLSHIAILSDWFESNVHFVHVREKGDHDFETVERDILDALLALQKKPLKVDMISLQGIDIVNAIFSYTAKIEADLLIMVSEKRNFLQKLLFQSMTRKAALETSVPTMIMTV